MSSDQKLISFKTVHSKLECLFNDGYGNLINSFNFSVLDDCALNDGFGEIFNSLNMSVISTVLS